MLLQVFILLASLTALVVCADKFVFGSSSLARNLGVSPMIIGLTIVAMGSSAPEMIVAVTASLNGSPDTAIGNAIGSNITNIALVLGITALFQPLVVSSSTLKREIPLTLAVTAIAYWMLLDFNLSFVEGLILLIGFFAYIVTLLLITINRAKTNPVDDPMILEAEKEVPEAVSAGFSVFWVMVGIIGLPLSAHFLVDSSTFIAKTFGVSDLVIGLTIIAIGTSLPELAASIMSIIKKEDDLALGNIIGSNIFNILAVLAIPGLIAPGGIDEYAATRDAPYMLGVTFLLFVLCFGRRFGYFRITRIKGAVLVLTFILYQVLLFSSLNSPTS